MNIAGGDRFYHERRAAEEQLAASAATKPQARAAHARLARLHRDAATKSMRAEDWR